MTVRGRPDVADPPAVADRPVPSTLLAVGGAAVGLVALAAARRHGRRLAAAVEATLPLGPGGIIVGAEPFVQHHSATHAALVIHGFSDTPQSVLPVAMELSRRGWSVEAPLLPGHGRTLAAFGASRADDWIGFVLERLFRLRRRYGVVALVGQSMGAALATVAAAECDDLAALTLLAPYFEVPDRVRRLLPLLRLGGWLLPFHRSRRGDAVSILDPAARAASRGFGVVSGRLLVELDAVTRAARSALPDVLAPTLVLASRRDIRVPVVAVHAAFGRLGAPVKRLEWLERSGHVIAVDAERGTVAARTADWLAACGGAPPVVTAASG